MTSMYIRRCGPFLVYVLWVHLPLCVTAGAGNPESLILLLWLVARNMFVYPWVRGSDRSWYQSSTACRKPLAWSMLSLVCVKTIWKIQGSCEKFLRILFTPYLVSFYLWSHLICFDLKGFATPLLTFKTRIKIVGCFSL